MLREPATSSARSTELLRPPVRSAVLQGPSANLRTACSGLRTRSENTRRRKISSMKRFMRCRRTWRAFPSGWSAAASLRHPGTPSTAASSRSPLVLTVSTCYMVVGGSLSYLQVPGESPGYFYSFHQESPLAKELSVFVDESDARPRSPTSPCSSANFPFPIQRSSTDAVSSKTRQG